MPNFAIVIGVDEYSTEGWKLKAAVNDAIEFSKWALGPGGVAPENMRLLLHPAAGARHVVAPETVRLPLDPAPGGGNAPRQVDLKYKEANNKNIRAVIREFQEGVGKGGQRLYFYYAGHGVSAPGLSGEGRHEPVLIPADVHELPGDENQFIGFSAITPVLGTHEPAEQFFFIDACRDFALEHYQPGPASVVGVWDPPGGDGGDVGQYILYATSPGQKAYEDKIRGRGVFASALLDALRGKGELALSQYSGRYEVRFGTLVRYVEQRVQKEIDRSGVKDWRSYVQKPTNKTHWRDPDPLVVDFHRDEVGKRKVRVKIHPSAARDTCRVRAEAYNHEGLYTAAQAGPPAKLPTTLEVRPGVYTFVGEAEGYDPKREVRPAFEAIEIELKLQPASPRTRGTVDHKEADQLADMFSERKERLHGATPYGGETTALASLLAASGVGEWLHAWNLRGPRRVIAGSLHVLAADPLALINVSPVVTTRSGDGQEAENVLVGRSPFNAELLAPGIYKAQMILPEGVAAESFAEVTAGRTSRVEISSPPPAMSEEAQRLFAAHGIGADEGGYFHASHELMGIARARLASLLGFAAFAALLPEGELLAPLKRLGVGRPAETGAGDSALLVLLADDRQGAARGEGGGQFLDEARVAVLAAGNKVVDRGGFERLPGFRLAAQRIVNLKPGSVRLELHLPGLTDTQYALCNLAGRLTVFVIVATESGGIEVRQYMLPMRGVAVPQDRPVLNPLAVRLVDDAQRYFAIGRQAPEDVLPLLVEGCVFDPLLGCVAGYMLTRAGRQRRYGDGPYDKSYGELEPSLMRNMLKFFGELPDSHVLAGLCDPERRDEHFGRAAELGPPICAEGVRVLLGWFKEKKKSVPLALKPLQRGLLPSSPWTAWVEPRPAIIIRGGRFERAPMGWEALESSRAEIEQTIRGVGCIEASGLGDGIDLLGTGFVVGEGVVMTADYIVRLIYQSDGGRWELRPGASARVNFAREYGSSERFEFELEGVIGLHKELPVALLRVARKSADGRPLPDALRVAAKAPRPMKGRKVYVVGYPGADASRNDPVIMERVFGGVYGVKRLQPGEVLEVSGRAKKFHHDCFTLGGNSGSCVVDLETNLIVGLHDEGHYYEGYQRGTAAALWRLAADPLLKSHIAFDAPA